MIDFKIRQSKTAHRFLNDGQFAVSPSNLPRRLFAVAAFMENLLLYHNSLAFASCTLESGGKEDLRDSVEILPKGSQNTLHHGIEKIKNRNHETLLIISSQRET